MQQDLTGLLYASQSFSMLMTQLDPDDDAAISRQELERQFYDTFLPSTGMEMPIYFEGAHWRSTHERPMAETSSYVRVDGSLAWRPTRVPHGALVGHNVPNVIV